MKICFVADGTSIHTQRWLNYFARNGHEVHLISSGFPTNYQDYDSRIKVHSLIRFLPKFWKVTRYLSGIIWLFQTKRLVKRIKPDILDCHYIPVNGYLGFISGFHPLVLTAWGSDILILPKRNFVHALLISISLRRADLIMVLSFTMTEETVKLGAPRNRIHEILIGVDTSKFKPSKDYDYMRYNIGISELVPVIISTRNLKPIYNIETLIRAMALVCKNIHGVKCIIVGEGSQKYNLQKIAESLGIRDSVLFPGYVIPDELIKYLTISDVYVSTSLSDGASNSLLEAMATGLAPIVSDIPANRAFIKDGQNGFLFPVRNHEILAKRIHYLIENREIRGVFGRLNREIVLNKADHYKEMAKVNSLYKEVATEVNRF